ncbi:hypothetical protein E0K89_001105 [Aquicoccus sp. SCR17]|nr:hypothetical protein [Carideicomes alvinocaridis]
MPVSEKENISIWETLCSALGTEYRDTREIVGGSGLVHPIEALGVDEKRKRLILISSESNPRVAALLRGDVQATVPGLRVMVARPMAIDISHIARKLFFTDQGTLDFTKLLKAGAALRSGENGSEQLKELYMEPIEEVMRNAARSALPMRIHIYNAIEQLHSVDWEGVMPASKEDLMQTSVDVLTKFSLLDNLAADREQGICPIPTYELSENDWDLFLSKKSIEEVQERLKELDIYQYFYPPADQLALGLIDRGVGEPGPIFEGFNVSELQGHEISANTLFEPTEDIREILEQAKANGYVVEGEFSMELTEEGRALRRKINLRPREGLIAKISKIVSIKVELSLKDLIGK